MERQISHAAADEGGAEPEHRPPPPATGVRTEWSALPAALRHLVEHRLGGQVIEAVTQPGGFSPGVAARLLLENGTRAFVKAVGPEPNPDSPGIHRAEARIVAALPESVPAPRPLGFFDEDGWVVLLFEDVDGVMPAQPWVSAELDRVLTDLADLAASLDPAPVSAPSVAERFGDSFQGWRHLARAHQSGDDDLSGLAPWARRHLTALTELEARWGAAAEGEALVHADLRADNLLLTGDRVVVVDWPWACVAAPWFDLLSMLPSVRLHGGPPPETLFEDHPVARGADRHAVTTVLAALTGFFVWNARQPAPPGLPKLRAFQAAHGEVALEWLRMRTGWE